MRSIYAEAAKCEKDATRAHLAGFAQKSESKRARVAMIDLVACEGNAPVLVEDLDRNQWFLNVYVWPRLAAPDEE